MASQLDQGPGVNVTILAPDNDAWDDLQNQNPQAAAQLGDNSFLTALLQYHVLSGDHQASEFREDRRVFPSTLLDSPPYAQVSGGQKVGLVRDDNDAMVLSGLRQASDVGDADIRFNGGVVHVIHSVLTLPVTPAETALDTGLTSFAGALTQTQLDDALESSGDTTVFAPSNEAFQRVGSAVAATSPDDLQTLLAYHVVPNGAHTGPELIDTVRQAPNRQLTLTPLTGGPLTLRLGDDDDDDLYVNNARVVDADFLTTTGVLHVLDNVLNPASPVSSAPAATSPSDQPAFPGAQSMASAPFTDAVQPTTTASPDDIGDLHGSDAPAPAAVPIAALLGVLGGLAVGAYW